MAQQPSLKLKEGDPAPDFSAATTDGKTIRLSDLRGGRVVLFFYPKDDTPGCTKEACAFRDEFAEYRKRGVTVLGVSVDPVKAHVKFTEKFSLPFQLVADTEKRIVHDYGVWGEKRFMGRRYMGTHRVTFLIGADGKIERIWPEVKPAEHAREILAEIDRLA